MAKPSILGLQALATDIASFLRSLKPGEVRAALQFRDYHEFEKALLPRRWLDVFLAAYGYSAMDVQVEVVLVTRDLSHQIHYHNKASEYCIVLGEAEGFEKPRAARCYLYGIWRSLSAGSRISIPKKCHHEFTADPYDHGTLAFLSVQSPPLESEHGDDYHRIPSKEMMHRIFSARGASQGFPFLALCRVLDKRSFWVYIQNRDCLLRSKQWVESKHY